MQLFFLILILIVSPSWVSGTGTESTQDDLPKIGIYEHLGEQIPSGLFFVDENGDSLELLSIINKPTLLSFVYFDCPGLCSPLMDGVSKVVEKTDMVLGIDYQVVTISFNYDDTPEKAMAKKKAFSDKVLEGKDPNSWHYLTADSVTIKKITDAVGFGFKRQGQDFLHAAAIMVLSPQGKISRYLYGTYFLPFDLKMAVVEAAEGRTGPTINKVLKFCFNYDPEAKKYVFDMTKIMGTLILIGVVMLFVILNLKPKTKGAEEETNG